MNWNWLRQLFLYAHWLCACFVSSFLILVCKLHKFDYRISYPYPCCYSFM